MNAEELIRSLVSLFITKDTGKRKPMKIQSLIFSKDYFDSASSAKAWADKHNFKNADVDETGSSYRLRQKNPGQFKKMRTIELTTGVKAVVGKMAPTRSDVHVPSAGTERVIPHNHKQRVLLGKSAVIEPTKTAGQLHDLVTHEHDAVGGTIRTGGGSDAGSSTPGSSDTVVGSSGAGTERFVFGPMIFDIDKARDIMQNRSNATIAVSPDWSHKINVDGAAALDSTSTNPVMVAQIPTTNGLENLLIDGHHRMHKALHDGKKTLPAFLFSPGETLSTMDTHPKLMKKMRENLKKTNPMVSNQNPGDGKPIDSGNTPGGDGVSKDLDPDTMDSARQEVGSKDDAQIETETSEKWAARAIASFEQGDVTQAEDYGHEALEHAALVKDMGKTVSRIENELRTAGLYKNVAKDALGYSERQRLHDETFAIPSERKYPIPDIAHARNALARVAQHGTPEEKKKVQAAVYAKYPSLNPTKKTQSFTGAHSSDIAKDTNENQLQGPTETGEYATGGLGDNALAGMYNMQSIVTGMDWELEHNTTDPDLAKEMAISNLEDDPQHYRKLRLMDDGVDWSSAFGVHQGTGECPEDDYDGIRLDVGSGPEREKGFIGLDLQKHDHGTIVHDVHMGLPFPDESCSHVILRNSLDHMDDLSSDPKPLLSEIQRVLMPGGQFVYEGPNQIQNQPDWLKETWSEKFQDKSRLNPPPGDVAKIEGQPSFRQEFARLAVPDAATANDSEPRIGVAQYDMLPADALLAMDAMGYYWSDATSSGRGNRLHGYPSQGALVKNEHDPRNLDVLESALRDFFGEELQEGEHSSVDELTDALVNFFEEERAEKYGDPSVSELGPGRLQKALVHKNIPIFKSDPDKQIVYGVVLEPHEVDLQEDWMQPDEIEKTAHFWMMNGATVGDEHEDVAKAKCVESYIAPCDFEGDGQYGTQQVKKGSWVIGVKILDPKMWEGVKTGEYTGFSVGGWGQRSPSNGPEQVSEQW